MPKRRWSDEDVTDLRIRVAGGETVRDIARAIGRSQEATRARMQSLGLTTPRAVRTATVEQPEAY